MASSCIEKFQKQENGEEKRVYWRQDKHVHNAGLIVTIEQALRRTFGGSWSVLVNSYRSNQSSPPNGGVSFDELL